MERSTYKDLESAGRELASALALPRRNNPVVLAIANSGLPVAIPIAESLVAPLDLVIIRRLFVREDRALPVCAVSIAGNLVLDSESRVLSFVEEQFMQQAVDELSARAREIRGNVNPTEIAGKNILLVDVGIHTGGTIRIAVGALRKLNPLSITIAVPVADAQLKETVEALADEVVCLQWPEKFGHAGMWYKNFNRPNDQEVRNMIENRSYFGRE